jgi:hypothetical protein
VVVSNREVIMPIVTTEIPTIDIYDMPSFRAACEGLGRKHRWIFRGQTKADWKLTTGLERALMKFASQHPLEGARNAENNLLREFRRHFHRYSLDEPLAKDKIEWLAVMQHHGAPTRLLDWTFSEYVALFFAINGADVTTPCSVWALNQTKCWANLKRKVPKRIRKKLEAYDKDTEATNYVLSHDDLTLVAPLNPFRLNARLSVQQGTFLVPLNMNATFMENFESAVKGKANLCRKFDIQCSPKFLSSAYTELKRMNITDLTLFPDLDGLARSTILSVILEHLQPMV